VARVGNSSRAQSSMSRRRGHARTVASSARDG
jgi:hypothetical protein